MINSRYRAGCEFKVVFFMDGSGLGLVWRMLGWFC